MKHLFYSFFTFALIALANVSDASAQQVNSKIQEVYGDKTQEIAQSDPERIKLLNDLLDNRIKIIEMPVNEKEVYPKLSDMPLLNKYNSQLQRDLVFNPDTFNPLKYSLNFFSLKTEVYRVDNTAFLIVINSQGSK